MGGANGEVGVHDLKTHFHLVYQTGTLAANST